MSYEVEKKLAVNLLNVFGYVNANEDNIKLLELGGSGLNTTYIDVQLGKSEIQFARTKNSWEIQETEIA